ncbi:MAG: hypothetical protein HQK75_17520 [Candidatus Magnetomorum sp.]|nr:hypothetical protein [Candidatus Magnetomorum sp.]
MKYPMKKFTRTLKVLVFVFASLLIIGFAHAGTQSVTLTPESVVAFSDEATALQVYYDVIDGKQKTTGIGIRIHFNSKVIENISLSDVYGEGMVGQHYSPQKDINNLDNDTTTDMFIIVAWAGITGQWPAFLSMPGAVATLNLKIKADAPNTETKINVTASSIAAGYNFKGNSTRLLIQ